MMYIASSLCFTNTFADTDIKQTIKSASELDYPPFCIVSDDRKADGFSVELLQAAIQKMGLDVEFKIGVWTEIKSDLKDGKIDVLPLVGRTPEREAIFDFTFTYLTLHGAIFAREGDTRIKTEDDLADKEIIVMKGDNAEEYVRREGVSPYIITVGSYENAMKLLASGKHDAVIAQRLMGVQLLKNMEINGIVPLEHSLVEFRQDFSFAVQDGNRELLALLNEGLSIVMVDGTYEHLYEKWLTPTLRHRLPLEVILKYVLIISVLFTLIILLMLNAKSKQIKKALENEKQKLFMLLDQLPAFVYLQAQDHSVAFANKYFRKHFGDPEKRTCYGVLWQRSEPCETCPTFRVFDSKKPQIWEWTETPNGRMYKVYDYPYKDVDGTQLVLGLGVDITDSKTAEDQIRKSLKEKEILLGEIYHRTKNNMQIISSLIILQSEKVKDKQLLKAFNDIQNRINSMSLVHTKLYQAKDLNYINLNDYLVDLIAQLFKAYHISHRTISLKTDIDDAFVTIDTAIPCGLVVNEIITNVLKYAFLDNNNGEIRIDLHTTDDDIIELKISDNGVGMPDGIDLRNLDSLGLQIIYKLVESQLSGEVVLNSYNGVEYILKFPNTGDKTRI